MVKPAGSLVWLGPKPDLRFFVEWPDGLVGEAGRDKLRGVAVAVLAAVLAAVEAYVPEFCL